MMRFIATHGYNLAKPTRAFQEHDLAGSSSHVATYRTLRNAIMRAGPHGAVYMLELGALRRIDYADFQPKTPEYKALTRITKQQRDHLERYPHLARELGPPADRAELADELALAERQMIAWSERAMAIEKKLANHE